MYVLMYSDDYLYIRISLYICIYIYIYIRISGALVHEDRLSARATVKARAPMHGQAIMFVLHG